MTSLGLENLSSEQPYLQFLEEEPDLASVWSTPERSMWSSTPSAVVWVRRKGAEWQVAFIPNPSGGDGAADLLSNGFSRCIAQHEPSLQVETQSHRSLDFR
jgi:hypothetical protein